MGLHATRMISVDASSKKGGGGSNASIAYDGKQMAFYSQTSRLVSNDKNGLWDIFLWEQYNQQLKRISLTADGKERNPGEESVNRIVAPTIVFFVGGFLFMMLLLVKNIIIHFSNVRMRIVKCAIPFLPFKFSFLKFPVINKI